MKDARAISEEEDMAIFNSVVDSFAQYVPRRYLPRWQPTLNIMRLARGGSITACSPNGLGRRLLRALGLRSLYLSVL
jgi:hypothetical protein